MGINIGEIQDLQQKFWSVLTSTSNTYALSQLWLVGIPRANLVEIISTSKTQLNEYEPGWNFPDWEKTIEDRLFLGNTHYLLAQSVQFPGDSISVERSGVSQSGNIKGLIGTERGDLPIVTITFLETNQSFVDLVLRPWAIAVGHLSLKKFSLRIPEIQLTCYQKDGAGNPLKIRKIINLINAVPTNIDTEEYNYTGDKIIERQVQFAYTKYLIEASAGTTLAQGNVKTDILFAGEGIERQTGNNNLTPPSPIKLIVIDKVDNNIPTASSPPVPVIIDKITPTPIPEFAPLELPQPNLLERAENLFNEVQGKVSRVTDIVGRIASIVPGRAGQQLQANIGNIRNTVNQGIRGVGQVISTGVEVQTGIQNARTLGSELTTFGNPTTQNQVPIDAIKSVSKTPEGEPIP